MQHAHPSIPELSYLLFTFIFIVPFTPSPPLYPIHSPVLHLCPFRVNLAGDVPVFGSPCGCDISEKNATAILRFTSDSTHTSQTRSGSRATRLRLMWTNNGRARYATTRCVLSFITSVALLGGDSWQLIFANFQIIISAIPVFETALNGELFPPLPPRRGTIGGAHGLGISQAKLLNVSVSNAPLFSLLLHLYRDLAT